MTDAFIDTDILIRLLTGDDLKKQSESAALFRSAEAGEMVLVAPDTVIADAVYVLFSPRLYNLPRTDVSAMLTRLLRLTGFKVENRSIILRALELFGTTKLDFGDCVIVASMEHGKSRILYSYDTHFDRVPTITRRTPGATPAKSDS